MAQLKLTPDILAAALIGFEAQKNQLDAQISEIRGMLDGGAHSGPAAPTETTKPRKKRYGPGFGACGQRSKDSSSVGPGCNLVLLFLD